MYKHQRSRVCGRDLQHSAHALVLNGKPVHRGKQTDAVKMPAVQGRAHAFRCVRHHGVRHEVAVETIGISTRGGCHGLLISRNAGDQRRATHAVTVQFLDPDRRQRFGRCRWSLPAEYGGDVLRHLCSPLGRPLRRSLRRERRKKTVREEMDVCVSDFDLSPWALHTLDCEV